MLDNRCEYIGQLLSVGSQPDWLPIQAVSALTDFWPAIIELLHEWAIDVTHLISPGLMRGLLNDLEVLQTYLSEIVATDMYSVGSEAENISLYSDYLAGGR